MNKTVMAVAAVWLLGLSRARIDHDGTARQRLARAQPSIYAPGKALSWVQNDYQRSDARPRAYSFGYEVDDGSSHYGHQQESDGSVTTGSYRVLLPDGRTQIVNFRADENGYVADVKYEVSIYKPSSGSGGSYKKKAAGARAWTAFKPAAKKASRASYKADLMAAFGYKFKDGQARAAGSDEVLDANEIADVPATTHVIAESPPEYKASSSTTTPAPISTQRYEVLDSGPWTAFKAAEATLAPIYEAKAVYQVIPERVDVDDPHPPESDCDPITPEDVRIGPALRKVETPSRAEGSAQTDRSTADRPAVRRAPEFPAHELPERRAAETGGPAAAVAVPYYAREGYVAPTTYKPPMAFTFPARPAAASGRVSSAPAYWAALFRPALDATARSNDPRLPAPLIFRTRKASNASPDSLQKSG